MLPLAEWPKLELPDVVVVKKVYAAARRRNRMWKLRSIIKEVYSVCGLKLLVDEGARSLRPHTSY